MEEFFNKIKETFTDATLEFETITIKVDSTEWIETHQSLRDQFNLKFFSWLSAIDWDNEVSVGEAPKESVLPSFEIITCLSDLANTNLIIVSTNIVKSDPKIKSLVEIYAGANWHEREAFEMFGINFENHPNLEKLYLPDGYEGNPMLKSFELISREVKPWPGEVDVEGMPEESESDKSEDG